MVGLGVSPALAVLLGVSSQSLSSPKVSVATHASSSPQPQPLTTAAACLPPASRSLQTLLSPKTSLFSLSHSVSRPSSWLWSAPGRCKLALFALWTRRSRSLCSPEPVSLSLFSFGPHAPCVQVPDQFSKASREPCQAALLSAALLLAVVVVPYSSGAVSIPPSAAFLFTSPPLFLSYVYHSGAGSTT